MSEVENQFETLRKAAGILDVLKQLEQDSNLINSQVRLKNLLVKNIKTEYDLEPNEVKTIEDGVEGLIRDIIAKRNKQKQPETKETGGDKQNLS